MEVWLLLGVSLLALLYMGGCMVVSVFLNPFPLPTIRWAGMVGYSNL